MSMRYVPGKGYVDDDSGMVVGGQEWEDKSQAQIKEKQDRIALNSYVPDKKWTHYNWLQGSGNSSNPSFNQGPNNDWMSAMRDRAKKRLGGDMTSLGWYEMATQGYQGMDEIWNRNNGIESLLNQGYSLDQVGNFINGGELGEMQEGGVPWYEQLAESQGFLNKYRPQEKTEPLEKTGMFSQGNQQMRDFIQKRLENSLFGKGLFGK